MGKISGRSAFAKNGSFMICHPKTTSGLVTIIVPFFNREQWLAKTVTSILNQDYKKFQLLLIDDGSRDSSFSVARSFSDSRIECIQSKKRGGKSDALNQVIPLARGQWLNFFDSDDIMSPDSLSTRIDFLRRHPKMWSVMGRAGRLIDNRDRALRKNHPLHLYFGTSLGITRRLSKNMGALIPEFFAVGSAPLAPLSATLIRKEAVEQIGLFRNHFAPWEDREYLTRLALHQTIPFLDKSVLWYRVHDHNLSFKMVNGKLKKRSGKILEHRFRAHLAGLIKK